MIAGATSTVYLKHNSVSETKQIVQYEIYYQRQILLEYIYIYIVIYPQMCIQSNALLNQITPFSKENLVWPICKDWELLHLKPPPPI